MYKKFIGWLFDRNVLPYWCILLADCGIVLFSAVLCIAIDRGANVDLLSVGKTLCFYLLFYILGFRIMHTYKGMLRYSSFVDLYRIGVAMFISTVLIACVRRNVRTNKIPRVVGDFCCGNCHDGCLKGVGKIFV